MHGRGAVLSRVMASRPLRRTQLAFLAFSCAENGTWVALLVYAFGEGGTTAAAVVAVAQLLPAAAAAPFASRLTDRRGGGTGLRVGYVVQALTMGATAALLLIDAPSLLVYAGGIAAASAITFTRPAHGAVLPALVDDPAELTAANAVTGWADGASLFLGPALAGVCMALSGPGAAFALFALAAAVAAVLVAPLARHAAAGPADRDGAAAPLAALRAQRGGVPLLAVNVLQFAGIGALDVLVVVLAIDVLGLGEPGAGYLNAAFGVGGILGGVVALGLVGRRRLAGPLGQSAVLWGVAFLALAATTTAAPAFALLAVAGVARTVLDVAGRTLLQRVAPAEVRGRVLGLLEGLSMLALAAGSLSVPVLAGLGGPGLAVAGTGALLCVAGLAAAGALSHVDRAIRPLDEELALLRGSPIFEALSADVLEGLARSLEPVASYAGEPVVRQGDRGARFYLVRRGRLLCDVGGERVNELGPGDGFGEIALLRDGVRTATVTPVENGELLALARRPFLEAVTGGHAPASLADARLGSSVPA